MRSSELYPKDDIPKLRLKAANRAPVNPSGEFVVYWMSAYRRLAWNFALDRAIAWAKELKKPLMIVEPLECDGPWASARFHSFVAQGMAEHFFELAQKPVFYFPFVAKKTGECKELFEAVTSCACVAVTDDYPIPHDGFPGKRSFSTSILVERCDSNGLLPVQLPDRTFTAAFSFRRYLQTTLRDYLLDFPSVKPFSRLPLPRLERLPAAITKRYSSWKPPKGGNFNWSNIPIDQSVRSGTAVGGRMAALQVFHAFLKSRLPRYHEDRNKIDDCAASGLSPYLHFGAVSTHEIFHEIVEREMWSPERLAPKATGKREGWWGMSREAEAFLDELVTWREIGFNYCERNQDYAKYESLPDWALKTLAKHAKDKREYVYTEEQFELAKTHDPLWNAAQRQLVREGEMHNYLRMLWGKKILQWSRSPEDALETMIRLNDKYALDGSDPNSYSGICWVLGRYDRAWGPERPIFGTVRYMCSENTARKISVKEYLRKYA